MEQERKRAMVRPVCFFDLDHTLYNTPQMFVPVREDMLAMGAKREDIECHLPSLIEEGYSFDKHLKLLGFSPEMVADRVRVYHGILSAGDQFLLPGVIEGLRQLCEFADCHLLTFGYPPYQTSKFEGISSFQLIFNAQHYVWRAQTKGDVIRGYGEHAATYYLEDSTSHLADAREKAPWTRCVRIRWPHFPSDPHPRDGRDWTVIRSFDAFLELVTEAGS